MGRRRDAAAALAVLGVFVAAGLAAGELKELYFQPTGNNLSGTGLEETEVETVATGLKVPWGIDFLPSGDMLVTQRNGTLRRIGKVDRAYQLPGVVEKGESGLLGVELHPGFEENRWIYLYHTRETGDGLTNRVVRYRLVDGELADRETVISGLPGAVYHDGGRIEFGPDGKLYVTVGDATEAGKAQELEAMNGKILRLNADGSVPGDNPFGNAVYSYGHRNPQGLAWVPGDGLWATEHGNIHRDELNRIVKGGNYGWPVIRGDESRTGMIEPVVQSGSSTWAPAGAAYFNGSIFFAGLRGQSLYEAEIQGGQVVELESHFRRDFGRLRAVEPGPGGEFLYVTTSNRDGRGEVRQGDDRILRIDPGELG